MRDLAKIVKIRATEKIEGYDRIQLAYFEENAYQAIVPIDIKVGDLVCWIEADSLLPDVPQYEFLRKRCFVPSLGKLRIRVMKMAGHKSWGLVLKLNEIPLRKKGFSQGDDVTDYLGITKYEPAEDASPKAKRTLLNRLYTKFPILRPFIRLLKYISRKFHKVEYEEFPSWLISKTDETSIQLTPKKLEVNKDVDCYVTVKIEGQSATYFIEKGKLMCCSRNYMYVVYSDCNYCQYAKDHNVYGKLMEAKKLGFDLIVQGELAGPGIQKNIYKFQDKQFYVFNMYDRKTKKYLDWSTMIFIASKVGFNLVPEVRRYRGMKLSEIMPDVASAEAIAKKMYFYPANGKDSIESFGLEDMKAMDGKVLWKDFYQHEGIVVRGLKQEFSFKVKNIDYAEWFGGK